MNLEQRTIEILSQVVYKEMCEDRRQGGIPIDEKWWKGHKEQTLELARNIIRVNQTINPTTKSVGRETFGEHLEDIK